MTVENTAATPAVAPLPAQREGPPLHRLTYVQMNCRVPNDMRDAIDARRRQLDISRDEWVRRALTWALCQPIGTPAHSFAKPERNGDRPR